MIKHLIALSIFAAPALAEEAFVDGKSLTPELALTAASAALEFCSNAGYQAGVMVVDRSGEPQVYLRDRYAGMHVFETARRKAWTAVSFKTDTADLAPATEAGQVASAIRHISEALPLAGGMVIYAGDGAIVGGIGVSGAPGPERDVDCAKAGLAAIEDAIAF